MGNIPYEATEEQLKDIFSEVGLVVSFRYACVDVNVCVDYVISCYFLFADVLACHPRCTARGLCQNNKNLVSKFLSYMILPNVIILDG